MIWGTVNARREAVIPLRLRGPSGIEVEVPAVIDTGFSGNLTLPAHTRLAIGAVSHSTTKAILVDGSTTEYDLFRIEVWWAGRWKLILATGVGTDVLAGMRLLADCEVRIQVVPGGEVEVFPLPEPPI